MFSISRVAEIVLCVYQINCSKILAEEYNLNEKDVDNLSRQL